MIVDLKRFFQGQSDTVTLEVDLSGLELGGVKPFCAPVKAEVGLRGFADSVILDAHADYSTVMPCDRCGESTRRDWSRDFSHVLVRELGDEQDDDTYVVVSDERLDLEELLREDILLELPSKYLCSSDCKGLCPKCGQNLNEGECGCGTGEVDPRLEILKSLL